MTLANVFLSHFAGHIFSPRGSRFVNGACTPVRVKITTLDFYSEPLLQKVKYPKHVLFLPMRFRAAAQCSPNLCLHHRFFQKLSIILVDVKIGMLMATDDAEQAAP